jgi:hypothetical protein
MFVLETLGPFSPRNHGLGPFATTNHVLGPLGLGNHVSLWNVGPFAFGNHIFPKKYTTILKIDSPSFMNVIHDENFHCKFFFLKPPIQHGIMIDHYATLLIEKNMESQTIYI